MTALSRYRKFLVALAGALAQLLLLLQDVINSGLLHGKALAAAQLAVAGLTALVVRQVRNSEPVGPLPEPIGDEPPSGPVEFVDAPPEAFPDDTEGEHQPEHAAPEA